MTAQEQNTIADNSNDRKYFILTPQLVWALSPSPFHLALWLTIKMIAGERGECYLSTPDLADAAMMSAGKCSQCRQFLLDAGLLSGNLRKDLGYPQPVWHLRIPDLWVRNLHWRNQYHSLKRRIGFKRQQKSFHQVKPSPGERGTPLGEEGTPPGETKKIHDLKPKEEHVIWEAALVEIKMQMTKATFHTWMHGTILQKLSDDHRAVLISCPTNYALEWLSLRLDIVINRTLIGILHLQPGELTTHYIVIDPDAEGQDADPSAEQLAFTT